MRKTIYKLIALLISAIIMFSCSGSDNEEVVDPNSIILGVSKKTIQANGSDAAALSVSRDGVDITSGSVVEIIAIDDTELPVPTKLSRGAKEFCTVTPGKYRLRASYYEGGTSYSVNTVDITATESSFGKYHRKMLAMQFTSVGCTNCPSLSTYIKTLMSDDDYKDKLVPVSFHMDFMGTDPMTFKHTSTYMNLFGQQGLPAFYLDFRKEANALCKLPDLQNLINTIYAEENTACGVAIESVYDDASRKLTISAKVTSEFDNSRLKVLAYLIENDIRSPQGGAPSTEPYYHQNVVRDLLSNSHYGDKLNQVSADVEKSIKYTTTVNSGWNTLNMKVVVCVMATKDGGNSYYVTNATECALGSSVDYIYTK